MPPENIRCVLVWSGWLRLSHWLLAAGVLFQLLSAWALEVDTAASPAWRDWHVMVGQLLCLALLLRLVLLFVPGSSHWRNFLPQRRHPGAMAQMLRFYLSLGRAPLPNWYAHNPAWLPVYPLVFLALAGACLTGFWHDAQSLVLWTSVRRLHAALGQVLGAFALAHGVAALLHDWKGKGAGISAMLSGHRYFHVSVENTLHGPEPGKPTTTYIPLESLRKRTTDAR